MGKPIGELQGWWAISQKVLLVSWPMLIAFGAWQVRQPIIVGFSETAGVPVRFVTNPSLVWQTPQELLLVS